MDRNAGALQVAPKLPHQTTSFVGREQEILEIIDRLNDPRCQLLTFVGPGGIGKTRLALEVARQISDSYADGIYFIELQPLRSAAYIPSAIAHALGLAIPDQGDPLQQLIHYLQDRHLLLILDNFEHLMEGVESVSAILVDAPSVRLLVTSREALKLHEEWQWTVQGLAFPAGSVADEAGDYSALRLFSARAQQIRPDFTLTDHRAAVARICRLVEGIPLALEMAANWLKTLPCEAIADAIQSDVDFLTSREQNIPERHRSMRAVYNHSWRLLSEEERGVFEKLSVFGGGFTREAAQRVAGAALPMLASLVDKSFVRQEADGRYDIHELLRQYGTEQLTSFGSAALTADDHAAYFANFLAQREPELKSEGQLRALNEIEADFENIRAAWSHAVAQSAYVLVDRMIDSLFWFGQWRGRFTEVRALFEVGVSAFAPDAGGSPPPVWGRLLVRASRTDLGTIDGALALARLHGNAAEAAFCLLERGIHLVQRRQFAKAINDFQAALEIYRSLGDRYGMSAAISRLTYTTLTVGDSGSFKVHIDEGLRLAREMGNPAHLYNFLFRAGWSACFEGQYDASERDLREAVTIANHMGFPVMAADGVGSLAFLAFLRGDFQQARAWITHDLEMVTQIKAVGEQGFAKIVLAHVTCGEGDYREARKLAEEALTLVAPHPVRERFIARVLAMAECGLENFDQAREHARRALADEMLPGTRLWIMPVFALLLAHDGDAERSAQLLGLLFTHRASATGWLGKWSPLNDLRAQLAELLGAEAYAGAWEHGSKLDLDAVVAELLLTTDTRARQPLAEPLTERELEVLRLVAAGMSNREIADLLTVVEGTIRTHIYNLCRKLDAGNRTQAVARARVLHLLL